MAMLHGFILRFVFGRERQPSGASNSEHIEIENDFSKMISAELSQAQLLWMMDVFVHVFQHSASEGWKRLAALVHPHLREAQKETPCWR